jgi:VWFA-related protein
MERRFVLAIMSAVIAAVCLPGGARAQSAGPPREVALDLVVRDKHGHPVRDLRLEEITVTDGGEPASIRSVRLAGTSPEGAGRQNRAPHVVVLMFDALSGEPARFARDSAMELVKGAAEADAVLSVVCVASRLGVLQPFTADRDALKKSIEIATVSGLQRAETVTRVEDGLRRLPQGAGAGGQAPPARLLLEAVAASERAARDQQARPAMASLAGLARTLAKLPGRKAIVYFSEGMRLSTSESPLFQGLIGESNSGHVSVYAVDASETSVQASVNAMMAVVAVRAATASLTNSAKNGVGMSGTTAVQAYPYPVGHQFGTVPDSMPTSTQDALRELSVSTGGLLVKADADTKKEMRRILEDEANYYEVVYAPHEELQQGQFRKTGIKATRPGLQVQGPSGYFALPSSAAQFAVFEAPLAKAIREQSGAQAPELRVRAFEVRPGAEMVTGEVVVEVPLSHLQIQELAAEKVARLHFSLLALILDGSGLEIARCSGDVPMRIALESKDRVLADGFTFARPFTAPPGKYRVEVAIQDRLADRIALAHTAFESRAANGPAMSEAILARRLEAAPPASDLDDPMLYGAQLVVPDLRPVVTSAHSDTLPLFLILYPDLSLQEAPTLTVQLVSSGVSSRAMPLALGQTPGRRAIPYVVDIPVKTLRPGEYKVTVNFAQGAVRIQREAAFVVAGERPAALSLSDTMPPPPPVVPQPMALPLAEAAARPSEKDQAAMLAGARERALAYSRSLPSFTCIETTRRYALKGDAQEWKPQDTLSERVQYQEGREERSLIEVNGAPAAGDRSSLPGTSFRGEFGHLLKVVFGAKTQAEFIWKETVFLDGVRCQVFSYTADRTHSAYELSTRSGLYSINVAYIGTVYIDAATFNIRRVSLDAIDIPGNFPVRSSTLTVDYAYVRVGDADYLLPVSGAMELQEGRKGRVRNEVRFADYHRFGSQIILGYSND